MIKKALIILLVASVAVLGGLFVMISGIIPIKASSGHWEVTKMILKYSMSRSVSTYSLFAPEKKIQISNEEHFRRGFGHYEIGCRMCHGIPGNQSQYLGTYMTASAPYLPETVSKWDDDELFTIVKHGVKFTGMPHWPDLTRDDEVWSMVSFIKELPNMNRQTYENLAPKELVLSSPKSCHLCHNSENAGITPMLQGQSENYLIRTLHELREKKRSGGTMQLVASGLSDEEIAHYASHFSSKSISQENVAITDRSLYQRGEEIAEKGIPEKKVAACTGCHGPHWTREGKNPEYPRLIGLKRNYLNLQLELFQAKKRGSGKFVHLMEKALGNHLTEDERKAVSYFYEKTSRPVEVQE